MGRRGINSFIRSSVYPSVRSFFHSVFVFVFIWWLYTVADLVLNHSSTSDDNPLTYLLTKPSNVRRTTQHSQTPAIDWCVDIFTMSMCLCYHGNRSNTQSICLYVCPSVYLSVCLAFYLRCWYSAVGLCWGIYINFIDWFSKALHSFCKTSSGSTDQFWVQSCISIPKLITVTWHSGVSDR